VSLPLCDDPKSFVAWLDHWQTLVGAGIAIPFFLGAIVVPTWQESSRLRRRFTALRATMPLTLSEVVAYALNSAKALRPCRTAGGVNKLFITRFIRPPIPEGLVGSLERIIEAIPNRKVINRLALMIGEMQVLDSRMSGLRTEEHEGHYLDVMMIQAGTIHAQASSLFSFARRSRKRVRALPWSDVVTGLHVAEIRAAYHPDVFGLITAYAKNIEPEDTNFDPDDYHRYWPERFVRWITASWPVLITRLKGLRQA
jgi:hypothetical protein